MVTTYRTEGRLTDHVSDLQAARAYLQEPQMEEYVPDALRPLIHTVTWDLASTNAWFVQVVTSQPLDAAQLTELSEWISGQNSDGVGEGFEQQPFAEIDLGDDEWDMVSFDWGTNPCTLRVLVQS